MRIFGLAGWSGSGKTTLLTALIPRAGGAGPHGVDDQACPSRIRYRPAGQGFAGAIARPAPARSWSPRRGAGRCMHELRGAPEPTLEELVGADEPGRSAAGRGLQAASPSRRSRCTGRRSASRCSIPTIRTSSRSPRTSRCAAPLPLLPLGDAGGGRRFHPRTISGSRAMAQLSDDCFAFGGALLGVDAALALIDDAHRAGGRASRPCRWPRPPAASWRADLVAADRSAAARQQRRRRLCGRPCRSRARPRDGAAGRRPRRGRPSARPRRSRRGEAIRIFTGAPMPEGADTVMMQEDCVVEDGRVRLKPGIRQGANRRHAGEDVAKGAVALPAGRRLRPADLGLPPRSATTVLPVFRPLRVALLSTGDEVREPGTPLPPGAIYDANRVMLRGAAARARLHRQRSRHPARPRRRARRHARRGRAAARSDRDLGRRLDRRGGPRQGRDRSARAARFLAPGDQAGPAGGVRPGRRRRAADRAAGQPGRRGGDFRDPRPAADPAARRRRERRRRTFPGAGRLCLPQEAGPPRISARHASRATAGGLVARQVPEGRRRHPVLDRAVGRVRHPRRERSSDLAARRDRRFSAVLRGVGS